MVLFRPSKQIITPLLPNPRGRFGWSSASLGETGEVQAPDQTRWAQHRTASYYVFSQLPIPHRLLGHDRQEFPTGSLGNDE